MSMLVIIIIGQVLLNICLIYKIRKDREKWIKISNDYYDACEAESPND